MQGSRKGNYSNVLCSKQFPFCFFYHESLRTFTMEYSWAAYTGDDVFIISARQEVNIGHEV